MRITHRIYNKIMNVKEFIIKNAYIITPLVILIVYVLLKNKGLQINDEFDPNVINVSGVLAGFLFSSLGIMMSLPDNKFTELLRNYGYMNIIYKAMFIGIITLILTLVLGIFKICNKLKEILFIIGLTETVLSAYYVYKITSLASKSR
ncbi:hypothetical protein [Clostridium cochlearium]|uniref:Uncharacterized protein n=1 Tax=Clostridium cochlearium TaxID=1494 RepID=A0A7Y3V527_CLOCO|nr:hypothetical protein [Clostridium cochlearium]NOH14830.1 hypothetical protein [Clostridium cochlearium]